jgi:hypothetical protein
VADRDNIRHELAKLCSSKKTRDSAWTRERPTDWRPMQVKDPRSGAEFTPAGAWDFVVELLEGGAPLREMSLEKPPGKTGWVLVVDGVKGEPQIYIKLQLVGGMVVGRSFHNSEYPKKEAES